MGVDVAYLDFGSKLFGVKVGSFHIEDTSNMKLTSIDQETPDCVLTYVFLNRYVDEKVLFERHTTATEPNQTKIAVELNSYKKDDLSKLNSLAIQSCIYSRFFRDPIIDLQIA